MSRVRFELNEPEFTAQVGMIQQRKMRSILRRTVTQARQDVPVDTGHLGRSHGAGRISTVGLRTTGSVHANAHYAVYVHQGTGGPERRIYPKRAQALRFQIGGRTIFAAWVRGVKARPWLRNAAMRIAAQETGR